MSIEQLEHAWARLRLTGRLDEYRTITRQLERIAAKRSQVQQRAADFAAEAVQGVLAELDSRAAQVRIELDRCRAEVERERASLDSVTGSAQAMKDAEPVERDRLRLHRLIGDLDANTLEARLAALQVAALRRAEIQAQAIALRDRLAAEFDSATGSGAARTLPAEGGR